jgi:hypothetical protein
MILFEQFNIYEMSFYCVYCNQTRSGKKGSPEEKTDEHFIPQSIGGQWKISVCNDCNQLAGSTCDAFFAHVSWSYKLYRQGIVNTRGFAELLDGKILDVYFKYKTAENGRHNFISCHKLDSHEKISRKEIKSLKFQVQNPSAMVNTYPAVLKIALGSAYHLVRRNGEWTSATQALFSNLTFADIRSQFLGRQFNPGGTGQGHGPTITSILPPDAETLLRCRENPLKRRHYISIEDYDSNLQITLCLYSMYFWRITIPRATLKLGKLEDEHILYNLSSIDPAQAANLMHNSGNIWINICLNP